VRRYTLRFTYQGKALEIYKTAADYGLEDGAVINCLPADLEAPITIIVRDYDGTDTHFKIKMTTKIGVLMDTHAKRNGVDVRSLRFLIDGESINNPNETPRTLEMDDQDDIFCAPVQSGC